MATSLEESKKDVQIGHIQTNTYHLVQSSRKSVQCDPEIICLQLKKEITEGKIYSLVGRFAERAK